MLTITRIKINVQTSDNTKERDFELLVSDFVEGK